MSTYPLVPLAGVATVRSGYAFKSSDWTESGVPVLKIANIHPGLVDLAGCGFVDEATAAKAQSFTVERDDSLIAMSGATVGKVGRVRFSERALVNQRVGRFSVLDPAKLDADFLYYSLQLPATVDYLTGSAYGSAQPNISPSLILNAEIPLPSLSEQKSITDLLCSLDDKIAANNRIVETSTQLSSALFSASLVSDSAIEAKLSEVCTVVSRGITPKYSEAEDAMIVLNQKCVRQQRISLKQARRTELSKVREEKILLHNDVLVNSTGQGTLGRVARWTSPERVTADSHITILRFDPSLVNPVCGGFAVLRSEKVITAMAEGSTGQTELSRRELGKLALLLPPAEVQDSLGQKLSEITEYSDALTQENQRLSGTRDALLPLLMSGKLRVREAEAVVEDVL
ncbi:restriction endonuclease subunit S [Corynebacterium casei]|uniref:restriction endonuclease subunit S n=1 Tax=Corynebacterium casei TaxID=160386 RepID=UPI003FD2847C